MILDMLPNTRNQKVTSQLMYMESISTWKEEGGKGRAEGAMYEKYVTVLINMMQR